MVEQVTEFVKKNYRVIAVLTVFVLIGIFGGDV